MATVPLDADPYFCMGHIIITVTSRSADFNLALFIGVLVILLLFSAFLSGSEVAFFSLKDKVLSKINNTDRKPEKTVLNLLKKPKELLATILIANNLINISIIILFTFMIRTYFLFSSFSPVITFLVEVVVLVLIIVVFGELMPKVYANQYNLRFARLMALPLSFLVNAFYPISKLLIRGTSIVERRIKKRNQNVSVEDIKQVIEITSDEKSTIDDKKILERIVTFSNVYVKQIMTSRVDVVAYDKNTPFTKIIKSIKADKFSRVPVFDENFDHIAGILYIKDLIPYFEKDDNFKWQKLLRKPYYVPENKKIDDLLREFQTKKVHIAIVVDEYGGFSGIITLEDILEEIVGEITDEFDNDASISFKKIDEKSYLFNAKTPLTDVIKVLNLSDDEFEGVKGEAESIGGLMIEVLGDIPEKGEKITIENLQFVAEEVDRKRIKEVKVNINN